MPHHPGEHHAAVWNRAMKNIPLFTSSYGLATLILREIAWNGRAYVLVRSVWNDRAAELLDECRQFCRAVGAEEIYACWDTEELPADHAYDMIDMTCLKADLPAPRKPVELEQVTPDTAEAYLRIYNQCFRDVPSAASYDRNSLQPLYGEDLAWLAKADGQYAAVTEISKEGLEGIAVLPEFRGLGYDLAATVMQMVPSLTVKLKVASTNARARALYTRLGFTEAGISRRWYQIL